MVNIPVRELFSFEEIIDAHQRQTEQPDFQTFLRCNYVGVYDAENNFIGYEKDKDVINNY